MLIYNTTFMMLPEREPEFISWFRTQLPALTESGTSPRLSSLRAAGCAGHGQSEAQSVAFQMEFADRAELDNWASGPLNRVISLFEQQFGPEALTFSSIFETISICPHAGTEEI